MKHSSSIIRGCGCGFIIYIHNMLSLVLGELQNFNVADMFYVDEWDYLSYLNRFEKDSDRAYSIAHRAAFQDSVKFVEQFYDSFVEDFPEGTKINAGSLNLSEDGQQEVRVKEMWKPAFTVALNEMADWTAVELASRFVEVPVPQMHSSSAVDITREETLQSLQKEYDHSYWNKILIKLSQWSMPRISSWSTTGANTTSTSFAITENASKGSLRIGYNNNNGGSRSRTDRKFQTRNNRDRGDVSSLNRGYSAPGEGANSFDSSTHIDWSSANNPFGKSIMSLIRNQGLCGACWAFVSASSVEALVRLAGGKQLPLSVQELVDCDILFNKGCDGGNPYYAYQYIILNGLSSWEDYPYRESNGKCDRLRIKPRSSVEGFSKLDSRDQTQIVEYLRHGPVAVGICGTDRSFLAYSRGIYNAEDCCIIQNHAVLLVGFGHDDDTGLDYWVAQNSWGPSWGEKGYMRLLRTNDTSIGQCGLALNPVAASQGYVLNKEDLEQQSTGDDDDITGGNDLKPRGRRNNVHGIPPFSVVWIWFENNWQLLALCLAGTLLTASFILLAYAGYIDYIEEQLDESERQRLSAESSSQQSQSSSGTNSSRSGSLSTGSVSLSSSPGIGTTTTTTGGGGGYHDNHSQSKQHQLQQHLSLSPLMQQHHHPIVRGTKLDNNNSSGGASAGNLVVGSRAVLERRTSRSAAGGYGTNSIHTNSAAANSIPNTSSSWVAPTGASGSSSSSSVDVHYVFNEEPHRRDDDQKSDRDEEQGDRGGLEMKP